MNQMTASTPHQRRGQGPDARLRHARRPRQRSTSTSPRASSSCCSARRAAASRRCSTASPGCSTSPTGRSSIKGKNVTWEEPKDRGIGMVFQSYALYPQMTVRGNLSFGLKNAGLPKAEIDKRIKRAVGDPADRAAARAQARRPLRRPAPARRDRPGAGARRRRLPLRRAAVQPRRQAPLRAARRDQAAAPAAREHHDLRHPRPDRGADARRPHRGHARRHHPAARRPQDHLQQARRTSSSPASSARRR